MVLMFFFKKSKIVIDCFTFSESIARFSPIDLAIKYTPDWWKELPNTFEAPGTFWPSATMRSCTGFTDLYTKSIALPLWCDLAIAVENNQAFWQFSDQATIAVSHPPEQYGNYWPTNEYQHLKIDTPWIFRTKEDISWLWSCPTYNIRNLTDYTLLTGITNFSHIGTPNINLMLNVKENKKYILPVNHVMAHLTPLTEKKIDIRRHVLSSEEYNKRNNDIHSRISFTGVYSKSKKLSQKHSKCPFHKIL
jgi:hypothetical protein